MYKYALHISGSKSMKHLLTLMQKEEKRTDTV